MMNDKRSFKVIGVKKAAQPHSRGLKSTTCYTGRYESKTPSGAAKKAFTQHCNSKNIRGTCTLVIMLQETTQGSNKKVYQYRCKRERVDRKAVRGSNGKLHFLEKGQKAPTLKKGEKLLVFRYDTTATSMRANPTRKLKQKCKSKGAPSKKPRRYKKSSNKKSSKKKSSMKKKSSKKKSSKKKSSKRKA